MPGQENSQSFKRHDTNGSAESHLNTQDNDDLRIELEQALEGIEYGEIKIIVRDGRIVQIEKTTRNRPAANKKFST
jgi:hypothetical protein